ncbi:M23 family metallopeptidase [Alicyclobacillus kakegawensis]|uniref:M23 family metallopeptidase n=1 Tax=Alicyclobacillus kakegawensis TaxID=392012 RepID=UPI000831E51A|nr:M23 family metallopeptidase [Alicyclobacillus kakegawensis]
MEDNKNTNPSQTKRETEQAKTAPMAPEPTVVSTRKVFSKRWVYPAIYLGAAALIIGLMYARSQMHTSQTSGTVADEGNLPTQAQTTDVAYTWPVAEGTQIQVSMGFFPEHGSQREQAKALVSYDGGFYPHTGIDIKAQDGKPFEVDAAASGTVTAVRDDPLNGKTVEVTSQDGNVELYESLGSVSVHKGDKVTMGQAIGQSGTCRFEESQGNHLFFAVEKDGKTPVDPASVLPKR